MDPRFYIAVHAERIDRQRAGAQARLARVARGPSAARVRAGAILIQLGCRLTGDRRHILVAAKA